MIAAKHSHIHSLGSVIASEIGIGYDVLNVLVAHVIDSVADVAQQRGGFQKPALFRLQFVPRAEYEEFASEPATLRACSNPHRPPCEVLHRLR